MMLPNPEKVSILNRQNWEYGIFNDAFQVEKEVKNPIEEHLMDDDAEEPVENPSERPTQMDGRSSSFTQEEWVWLQAECADLRVEQKRQGVELFRQGHEQAPQGAMLVDIQQMMHHLMLQFPQPTPWQ